MSERKRKRWDESQPVVETVNTKKLDSVSEEKSKEEVLPAISSKKVTLSESLGLNIPPTTNSTDRADRRRNLLIRLESKIQPRHRKVFDGIVDINDTKHRYHLCKASTLDQLEEKAGDGVVICSRGKYYPDRAFATEKDPPLALCIEALTEEGLSKCIKLIKDLVETGPPMPPISSLDSISGYSALGDKTEKIWVDLDPSVSLLNANIRGRILGPQVSPSYF